MIAAQQLPLIGTEFDGAAEGLHQTSVPDIKKVALLLEHNDHLIFIVRYHAKDNTVSVEAAGGKIDPKDDGTLEQPAEALVREAHQELGVDIEPLNLITTEAHPYTKQNVGYYACRLINGVPYNAVPDEHLGIIALPINKLQTAQDISVLAIEEAEKIVADTLKDKRLDRPIECRIPSLAVMTYIQQIQQNPTLGLSYTP